MKTGYLGGREAGRQIRMRFFWRDEAKDAGLRPLKQGGEDTFAIAALLFSRSEGGVPAGEQGLLGRGALRDAGILTEFTGYESGLVALRSAAADFRFQIE